MFHKVKTVTPLPGFFLLVQFSEGITKQYDMNPLFEKYPMFLPLRSDPALYQSAKVDIGGYGVIWNDDIDIACDELFFRGEPVETPFDGLIAFGDATQIWGLNESTLRKAIAYGRLINGQDVCKYGKQWIITRSAMEREYGIPGQHS